jgi:hypothetical protein
MDPLTTDERIAALLDGKLGEQERAALLAELGLSRDELEILLNSAATLSELEEEDRAAGVIPITAHRLTETHAPKRERPPVWRRPAVLSAAAAAVLAIGGGLVLTRERGASPTRAVAELSDPGRGLPNTVPSPFSANRGNGQMSGRRQSVRYGALAADLEIAAIGNNLERFHALADSISELLAETGDRVALSDYAELAERPTIPPRDLIERLQAETAGTMDRELVAFGNWLEAARVAAFYGDQRFFRSRISTRYLHGSAMPGQPTRAAQTALQRARAAIRKEGGPDWKALNDALSGLLAEAG